MDWGMRAMKSCRIILDYWFLDVTFFCSGGGAGHGTGYHTHKALYSMRYTSNPFCSGYFGDRVS
jgi:hypothetical protein